MRRGTQLFSRSLSVAIMARAPSQERRTTSRAPVGVAPDPAATPEAVVQVYGARCSGWLGYFGVHTWIAVKPAGARAYTTYEVLDWRWRGCADRAHRQGRARISLRRGVCGLAGT